MLIIDKVFREGSGNVLEMSFLRTGRSLEYLSLGCFVDDANAHALISMENGNATFLDVPYRTRDKAVMKCALEAAKNDYKVFALQNGGECFSGSAALSRYAMYGDAHCPDGGKGGPLINEVYLLGGWLIFSVNIKLDVLQDNKKKETNKKKSSLKVSTIVFSFQLIILLSLTLFL